MNNQPENKGSRAKNIEISPTTTNLSSKNHDQCCNQMNPSTSKSASELEDEKNSVELDVLQLADISINQTEVNEIDRLINERRECKKPKTLRKLHAEQDLSGRSTEREAVGDDLNTKNEVHILCECEPSFGGAAVPTVISFNSPSEKTKVADSNTKITKNDSTHKSERIASTSRNLNCIAGKKFTKEKDNKKDKVKLGPKSKELEKKVTDLGNAVEKQEGNCSQEIKRPEESNQSHKAKLGPKSKELEKKVTDLEKHVEKQEGICSQEIKRPEESNQSHKAKLGPKSKELEKKVTDLEKPVEKQEGNCSQEIKRPEESIQSHKAKLGPKSKELEKKVTDLEKPVEKQEGICSQEIKSPEEANQSHKAKLGPKSKELEKKVTDLEKPVEKQEGIYSQEIKSPKESNQSLKSVTEKASSDMKIILKRPSLIPKLSRANTNSRKGRPICKDEEKREVVSHTKIEATPKTLGKYALGSNKLKESKLHVNPAKTTNSKVENQSKLNGLSGNTISLRMLSLQERLKATTNMLREKIQKDQSSCKLLPQQSASSNLSLEPEKYTSIKNKTIEDLYVNISELKQIASFLFDTNTAKAQVKYIEKLYKNISDIKVIADKLREHESDQSNDMDNQNSDSSLVTEKARAQKSSTSVKDNKIYIKFMPTRDGKRKRREGLEHSEEVQTDLCLGAKLTSDSLNNSDTCLTEIKGENKIKETDSMDGVFIPSCEPPRNLEEEEETTGLDITITFPEFNELQQHGTDSHIAVCLSDISAEALGKMKRCPKEFTLRMDFVEGKVLFHSGKGPANNFSIGPDLKFTENYIDNKKSDVINIKPSTECSFTSQMIPVEETKEANSSKTLKSTDSELFNVVNLPLLYKSPYVNAPTGHRSCISFKNDNIVSMSFMARQLFKSMPQIPSLANIFEDQIVDSFSKTAYLIQEKKRKNRQNQKKRISSNTIL